MFAQQHGDVSVITFNGIDATPTQQIIRHIKINTYMITLQLI